MCNYAVNSITFSSRNLGLLNELHRKVLECFRSAYAGRNLVKDFIKAHGYRNISGVNNTDHISACDESITAKEGVYYFRCETTTAWDDNMEPIIFLLKNEYGNEIRLSFCTEEPGSELFLVKDETGVFYPEHYKVEWNIGCASAAEYFCTFKDLFNYLQEMFPKAGISYFDALCDIEKRIYKAYIGANKNYYCCIYRFMEYQSDYVECISNKEVA